MDVSLSKSSSPGPEGIAEDIAEDAERSPRAAARGQAAAWWTTYAALVGRSLGRARLIVGMVCALLVVFQVALVVQAGSQFESQAFERMAELMPSFVRRTLGELTFAVLSFQGVVAAGYFHPVIVLLIAHLAVYLATEPAQDVEGGLVDLLLARPVPRHALITRSLILVALVACVGPITMAASMWAALHLFAPPTAPWPTVRLVAGLNVGLAAVTGCFGALALLIAARARRRAAAIAAASVIVVLMYLIVFLESTWAPARAVGWLSPFHYFNPIGMVAGRSDPWRDLLVLGPAMACLAGAAYWTFSRRDL